MEIQALISKWKLNRNYLASQIGMPKGTFNNKLSPKHPTQFSEDELVRLKNVLITLRDDLSNISSQ